MSVEHARALAQLLPPGLAWPRGEDTVFFKLLTALGAAPGRVDERANTLLREMFADEADGLLYDYARIYALPDPALPPPADDAELKIQLLSRFSVKGGITRKRYLALAAAYGYPTATITNYPFAGFGMGSPMGTAVGTGRSYDWTLNLPATPVTNSFPMGSAMGTPLREWGNKYLEAAVKKHNRATRRVNFTYGAI
jgi:uncharacterized protein YmfQ (DUF2313 family)